MIRINNTKLIRIVTDNPFMRITNIALKLDVPRSTVKKRIYKLSGAGRLVLQKRGKHVHVVTSYYAKKNHVPDVHVCEEKSTLELQMMFNSLSRSSIVV